MAFPIYELSELDSSQLEQLGTKPKFWYQDEFDTLCLFKAGRPNTGENWAEKVCAELCDLLQLPHAQYELANCDGTEGVITPSFIPSGARLVHGNELLAKASPGNEGEMNYAARVHTVPLVMGVMRSPKLNLPLDHDLPSNINSVASVFAGYLMFDALVGNQDRHFENWGLILVPGNGVYLAPSYDHASSLGRNETDVRRETILNTQDRGQSVGAYARRARSMLYSSSNDSGKRLLTQDAFFHAASFAPDGAECWIEKLQSISKDDFGRVFANVPDQLISQVARDFATEMLTENRQRLLDDFTSKNSKS